MCLGKHEQMMKTVYRGKLNSIQILKKTQTKMKKEI